MTFVITVLVVCEKRVQSDRSWAAGNIGGRQDPLAILLFL